MNNQYPWQQIEQWSMSAADVMPGLSLPEIHPKSTAIPAGFDWEPEVTKPDWGNLYEALNLDLNLAAEDNYEPLDITNPFLAALGARRPTPNNSKAMDILGGIFGDPEDAKYKGMSLLFDGAFLKTVASADQLFTAAIAFGDTRKNIYRREENQKLAYDNQMAALDNQVLHLKNQMQDRFNKTVATNIMQMAARNLRVSTGTLLEHTKDIAQEINEDMRMAESNAELKKLSLKAGKEQAGLAADVDRNNQWINLVNGATKLGMSIATGGGTMMSWGNLYAGKEAANKYFEAKRGLSAKVY